MWCVYVHVYVYMCVYVCVRVCVCVFVCVCTWVLALYPFIFHSSEGIKQDLCFECISKWNNIIKVSWTAISASFSIYNSTGGRSINHVLGIEIVRKGTSK